MTEVGEPPEPPVLEKPPEPEAAVLEAAVLDDDGAGISIGLAEVAMGAAGITAFSLLTTGMLGVALVAADVDIPIALGEAAGAILSVPVFPPAATGEPPST